MATHGLCWLLIMWFIYIYWVGKASAAAHLGLRPTSRYPGCERWKDCGRNNTSVPSNQQKFGNLAYSTSARVSKSRHSPGREWSGDSHWRVPKGLRRVTEEMPHLDRWPPSATRAGKENRHRSHHSTGSPAPVRTWRACLHNTTSCSSDYHQLWQRDQYHQPTLRRWDTTSKADPASWHGQERASMPRRHPLEPPRHRHSDHGNPVNMWLKFKTNNTALFRATTQIVIRMQANCITHPC